MQIGAPFQYSHAGTSLQRALYNVKLLSRVLLTKLLPAAFSPPVSLLVSAPSLQDRKQREKLYSEILRKGDATTRNMWVLGGLLVAAAALLLRLT